MSPRFEQPRSVAQAVRLLAGGDWLPLAGGTDVYPAYVGRLVDRPLLDLSRVAGLRGIHRVGGGWSIGATTTWTDVVRAGLPPLFDALKAAARDVGGVQIQNTGTVVGNVCNASPAADGIPVLMAMGAEIELRSEAGSRRLSIADFVTGARRTARRADELAVVLQLPPWSERARSAFAKIGGRRYLVISISMVAVCIDIDAAGLVTRAGIAVGSCSAVATRLRALEAKLVGIERSRLAEVPVAADLAPLAPIDDVRASAAYRLDATLTSLRRALSAVAA